MYTEHISEIVNVFCIVWIHICEARDLREAMVPGGGAFARPKTFARPWRPHVAAIHFLFSMFSKGLHRDIYLTNCHQVQPDFLAMSNSRF